MTSPMKSLFASNRLGHLGGMLLPSMGSSPASTSLLQPGASAKLGEHHLYRSLLSWTPAGRQHAYYNCEVLISRLRRHASCSARHVGHALLLCAGAEGETGEPMTPAEVTLRHCLSARTRRWAAAEFFCSAIDRPYFMRSELQVLPSSILRLRLLNCVMLVA